MTSRTDTARMIIAFFNARPRVQPAKRAGASVEKAFFDLQSAIKDEVKIKRTQHDEDLKAPESFIVNVSDGAAGRRRR